MTTTWTPITPAPIAPTPIMYDSPVAYDSENVTYDDVGDTVTIWTEITPT